MDGTTPPTPGTARAAEAGLGEEVRESLLLLGLTAAVTGLTALGGHVALVLLG
jgi:hypothetical protein